MLRKLREDKGALLKKMGDLYEAGKKADGMTEVQVKEYNDLRAQVEALDDQIKVAEDAEARASTVGTGSGVQVASPEEKKVAARYSLHKAIRQHMAGKVLDGIEGEMHQEAVNEARQSGLSLEGVGLPSSFVQLGRNQRDLTVGTTTAGGHTVATDLGGLIPILNPNPVVIGLGAQVLDGLVGNLDLPRHNTQGAASWLAENGAASEGDDAFNKISLTPHRLARITEISKQLLAQSSIGVEAFTRKSLEDAISIALDVAAINGSGSSNQPTGVLNTSGIGSVAGGTNGLIPTWGNIVALETAAETANALMGNLNYLSTPGVKGALKTALKASGVSGYIWSEDNTLNGYRAIASNNVPSTLTKGSASGICHAVIFGNWNELIIGQWAGVDITVDPYTKAEQALVRMVVNTYWDIALRHPASFAAMKDALIA